MMSMSARVQPQCRHILQSTQCADPCACSKRKDQARTCLKETLMKDSYDKICSENQLNALFTRQQKDKDRRRARDEPWRKLETKPEWRKRNIMLWETSVTRGDGRQDMQFEHFLDNEVLDTFYAPFHSISWHFPLYVHSHHGLSKGFSHP